MIILEGPDQIGKTTAANVLARLISDSGMSDVVTYRHMGKPPSDFDHVMGYLQGIAPVVQDRYHLGSLVYGMLLNRGGYSSAAQMRSVQRYLRWSGCLVVIMYGEAEWFRERFTERDELYSRELILESNRLFTMLAELSNHGEPYADIAWNVTRKGFPTEEVLRGWFESWKKSWRY